jgi:hypothetical protein
MKEYTSSITLPLVKKLRMVLSVAAFLASLFCFGFYFLPYALLKKLVDRLASDGNFMSFTPAAFGSLCLPAAALGSILFLVGLGLSLFPSQAERIITALLSLLRRFLTDAKHLLHDLAASLHVGWAEGLILLVILSVAFATRVMLLNRPIEYDEAYSFTQFARYPFRVIVSDYSAPNNHVFHTLLMRSAYLLLGAQPWQLRFPNFLIGLIIPLCAYLLGQRLYNKTTGFLAAGMLAALPNFILRSVSARGYTTVNLMFLLMFLLALYLLRYRNLFGWCMLAFFGAIGFYAVPTMLYPFCVVFLWMLLSIIDTTTDQYTWGSWLKYLVFAGLLAVGLTLFFYSPILLSPRAAQFFRQNNTLHSLSLQEFFQILPTRFLSLITEWQRFLPPAWSVIILIGLILSLGWIWKKWHDKIPTQLAFTLALGAVILIQRPDSVTRIWSWIVPLLAIWSSAGIVMTLQIVPVGKIRTTLMSVVAAGIIGGMGINGLLFSHSAMVNHMGEDSGAEEVTLAALPYITPETYIAVNQCYDARYWYYFLIHGVPLSAFYKPEEPRPFDRELALVYNAPAAGCGTEPVDDTLAMFGPDMRLLDMSTLRPVANVYSVTIYEVLPRK